MSSPATNTGLFVTAFSICALLGAQLAYQIHTDRQHEAAAAIQATRASQLQEQNEMVSAWNKAIEHLAVAVDEDIRKLARNNTAYADWIDVRTFRHGDVRRKGNGFAVQGVVRASKGDAELWWKWEREIGYLDDGSKYAGAAKLTGIAKPDTTGWQIRAIRTPRL